MVSIDQFAEQQPSHFDQRTVVDDTAIVHGRSDAATEKARRKSIIRGVLGVSFEYYDFIIFAALAPYFAKQIFPDESVISASLNTLAIFAIGFIARPIGAMLAGRLADRYGRKPVMAFALSLATVGSLIMACAPTYSMVGNAAVVILIVARLIQGLAHGMESISAFVYTAEMANPKWRTLQSCTYSFGLILGIIQGTLFGAILTSILSPEDMVAWGWRIPFVIGVFYGIFAVRLRRGMDESPTYDKSKRLAAQEGNGYWRTVWEHRRTVFILFLTFPATYVASYTMLVTFGDYAITMLKANPRDAYWATLAAQVILLAALPLWAIVSDKFGRRFNYTAGFGGILILIYPLQEFLMGPSFLQILIPMAVGLFFYAAISATEVTFVSELVPNRVRAQVISIPSSVSAVVFGGTSPYLKTWMTAYIAPNAFIFYFMILALIAIFAVRVLVSDSRGRDLSE